MKGKILTQGMGLISPSGISSRVERSNSGYSLTNSGVLLLTDDDNSVTNDQNNDMEDDPGVTEWCMDDFTPCASRSTSFYRGFFDSTHEKLSAAGVFKRPFQTGLCITLALGFISGVLGLFLGGLIASWNEESCTEPLDLSSKWQHVFTEILSEEQNHADRSAYSRFLKNSSNTETNATQIIEYLRSFDIWNSVSQESIAVTVYQPFSANLLIPNQTLSDVTRYLDMEPTLEAIQPYYYGGLEDIGSCQNLGFHLMIKRRQPTILLCGHSMPLETVPLLSAQGVQLVMIFNRTSIPDLQSISPPRTDEAYASFRQLPVPFIVIKSAVPNVFYSNSMLLSVLSIRKADQSPIIKAYIKGTLVEEELIVVAIRTTSRDSLQLADSMIRKLDLLVHKGWEPLRTIVFVLWNGKRTVMEKWLQQNKQTFSIRLKTFVDLTNPIEGLDTFAVVGSFALKQAAFVASKMVMSHHHDSFTLYDRWDNCISEKLPFNFTVPRMDYPERESIANLVQTLTNSAVISMQYKDLPAKDQSQRKRSCASPDPSLLSRQSLLESLATVGVRFLVAACGDPILPFNVLDVTHALQKALPADSESEVRSILKQLQLEATHIHAFLDFTVTAEQISLDEANSLNARLFFAFNALEDIFVRYGSNLERLKSAVDFMRSSENQLSEEFLDENKRILDSIKSSLKNGLEILSAEYT